MHIKNSQTKKILRYVVLGGGVAVLSLAAPTLPYQLLRAYVREKRFAKSRFVRDLKRFQKQELIDVRWTDDDATVKLLPKGEKLAAQYDLEGIEIARPKKWDGTWHLVMFDIPNTKRRSRDVLHWKLKEWGFYPLQKSVFVFPFPCENEVRRATALLGVREHVLIMQLGKFDGEQEVKRRFRI